MLTDEEKASPKIFALSSATSTKVSIVKKKKFKWCNYKILNTGINVSKVTIQHARDVGWNCGSESKVTSNATE